MRSFWLSGFAIATATTTVAIAAPSSSAATLFTAELDGLQVVSADFPAGIPTDASGFATFELNEEKTELTYSIDLEGVTLKPNQSDRTDPSDVTKIHLWSPLPRGDRSGSDKDLCIIRSPRGALFRKMI